MPFRIRSLPPKARAPEPTVDSHSLHPMKSHKPTLLKLATAVVCGGVAIAFSSCQTVSGFGRDVKKTGNAIERKADR